MKRSASVGVLVLMVLGACSDPPGNPIPPPSSSAPVASSEALPVVADVVCGPRGTTVSPARIAAQPDGIHVRVRDRSGKRGTYFNYFVGPGGASPGGGDAVESESVFVLGTPPGPLRMYCSYNGVEDRQVAVEVVDPAGAWQQGRVAAAGCPAAGTTMIDWVYDGTGATPEAAIAQLTKRMGAPVLSWRHAQDGYVESTRQSYVVSRSGRPYVSGDVVRETDGSYTARLGSYCSFAVPATGS